MADESLGHIDLRMVTSGLTGGAVGGGAGAIGGGASNASTLSAIQQAISNIGSLRDVIRTGAAGGGAGQIVSGGISAAQGLGGGAMGVALGSLAVGIAALAGTAYAIKMGVDYIKGRMDTLAKYNPALAMQGALDRLQDIRQSVQEASILQPLYVLVSQILREIKDLIFPLLLIIRLTIVAILVPILSAISQFMKSINLGLLKILQSVVGFLQSNPTAVPTTIGSILLGLFGFNPLGMSMAANAAVSTNNQMGNVIQALQDIIDLLQGKGKFNGNQWAINTLNALSVSSPVAPRLTPGGATSPWNVPMPSKVHP